MEGRKSWNNAAANTRAFNFTNSKYGRPVKRAPLAKLQLGSFQTTGIIERVLFPYR